MIRNLKTLGVAVVAVLAMSALAASAAQAQSAHITAAANSGVIKVTQDPTVPVQTFTTDVGAVECEEFSGNGSYAGGSGGSTIITSLTLENIEYKKNCELAGNEANINFGACHYTLNNLTWNAAGNDANSNVTLTSAGGCTAVHITVPITGCEVVVPAGQTFVNALTYTNVKTSTKEELTIHANVEEEIEYEVFCGGHLVLAANDGSYEGTLTAKAFDTSNNQVDLTATAT